MTPAFTGFPDEAITFYEGLEADNSKPYWTDHKPTYERSVQAPMQALLAALEPEFGEPHFFRPYRDVRFSKDKSPYKTACGGTAGKEEGGAYYVQISARGLMVGAGYWRTASDQVERLRNAVADDRTWPADRRHPRRAAQGRLRDTWRSAQDATSRIPARSSPSRPAAVQDADSRSGMAAGGVAEQRRMPGHRGGRVAGDGTAQRMAGDQRGRDHAADGPPPLSRRTANARTSQPIIVPIMSLQPTEGSQSTAMDEETRVALLELRASQAETRVSLSEFRNEVNRRLDDQSRKLDLIIDELAAFRAEYNQHTHE